MGNMHLITGYAGQEHITSIDQGAFNAALIGRDQFVLDVGNALQAQVISNNQIRILDGDLMMQGRFVRLDPGTYVDLNIENGAQGVKRNDLIVARYTKNTVSGVEAVDLVVIKGTAVENNPADPAYTEGDITDGAVALHDFPLWRIPLDGLNVGTPEMMFEPFADSLRTLPEIRQQVKNIHAEVDKKIDAIDAYLKEETLTDATKTNFGLGTEAVPDDVFSKLSVLSQHCWRRRHHRYTPNGYYLTEEAVTEFLSLYTGSTEAYYITYGTDITVNEDGEISLVNEQRVSFTLSYGSVSNANILKGKFYRGQVNNNGTATYPILYTPTTAADATMTEGGEYWRFYLPAQKVIAYAEQYHVSEWEYVFSANRNAYPDSGIVGGTEYNYLGNPLNDVMKMSKTVAGSYVGTGTWGQDSPTSLTFDFTPKIVMATMYKTKDGLLYSAEGYQSTQVIDVSALLTQVGNNAYMNQVGFGIDSSAAGNRTNFYAKFDTVTNTLYWYNRLYGHQFNNDGYTYYYIAIS